MRINVQTGKDNRKKTPPATKGRLFSVPLSEWTMADDIRDKETAIRAIDEI